MITAAEALRLDCAKLDAAQTARVERIMAQIEEIVRKSMRRNGCDISADCDLNTETDGAVVAEVNQRVKDAKWSPTWKVRLRPHPLNKALQETVGYILILAPMDAAYAEVPVSRILDA